MADFLPPHHGDDALAAQLAARDMASREDAVVLARLRSDAAARALGLDRPDPDPETDTDAPGRGTSGLGDARTGHPGPTGPAPKASPGPWPMPVPDAGAGDQQPAVPPGVAVPTGGPARVTTGVLAAAAAQRPRPEQPLLELRPTVLATDIDRIGDQLVVMKDRLELRDRHGGLRRTLPLAEVVDVTVNRRLTSAVLEVSTRNATDLIIKGLRPDAAESARATILSLCPSDGIAVAAIDDRSLMRAIVELHRAGVLDDIELAEKTALVTEMVRRSPRV